MLHHVCFSLQAYETLCRTFCQDTVSSFPLMLSIGPIHAPLEFRSRQTLYDWYAPKDRIQVWNGLERLKSHQITEDVLIWYSQQVPADACGLLHFVCSNPDLAISVVDVSLVGQAAPMPICVQDLDEPQFNRLVSCGHRLSIAEKAVCAEKWGALQSENAPLRCISHGAAVSAGIDAYDAFLLAGVRSTPRKVASVIASAISHGKILETDRFLCERIRALIAMQKIQLVQEDACFFMSLIQNGKFL